MGEITEISKLLGRRYALVRTEALKPALNRYAHA